VKFFSCLFCFFLHWKSILRRFVPLAVVLMLGYVVSGCSYIGTTLNQAGFSARFSEVPSQKIYKHMLKTDKFFVYGKIFNGIGLNQQSLAIVAISNEHQQGETSEKPLYPKVRMRKIR